MLSVNKPIYFLTPDLTESGVPTFLNVVLREVPNNEEFPQMDEKWTNIPVGQDGDFPQEMFLISKSGKLLFDYYPFYNGFICSEVFVSVVEEFGARNNFRFIPLTILNQQKSDLTHKKYFYLHPTLQYEIVDYDASSFIKHKYLSKNEEDFLGDTGIKYFKKLIFNTNNVPSQLFNIKDNLLSRYLCCSENFMNEAESICYGIKFINSEQFGMHYIKQFYPDEFNQISRDTDYYLNKRKKNRQK